MRRRPSYYGVLSNREKGSLAGSNPLQGCGHPVEGFGESFSGTGEIQPHKPFPSPAEFRAITQGYFAFFEKKIEGAARNSCILAVEPGQVSTLHGHHAQSGKFFGNVSRQEIPVIL